MINEVMKLTKSLAKEKECLLINIKQIKEKLEFIKHHPLVKEEHWIRETLEEVLELCEVENVCSSDKV